jgi:hypothetical protein
MALRDLAHRKRLIQDLTDTLNGKDKAMEKLLLVKCRMLKWALSQGRLEFVKVSFAQSLCLSVILINIQLFFETMDEQDVTAFLSIANASDLMVVCARTRSKRRNGTKRYCCKQYNALVHN